MPRLAHCCRCLLWVLLLSCNAAAAQAAPTDLPPAARDAELPSPAQGLALLPLLREAGAGSRADALERRWLLAHFAQVLDDEVRVGPRTLGAWWMEASVEPDDAALAAAWTRIFERGVEARAVRVGLPQHLRSLEAVIRSVGDGAWADPRGGAAAAVVAAVEMSHRLAHAVPLHPAALSLRDGGVVLQIPCRPRDAPQALPRLQRAVFVCDGRADAQQHALFVRTFSAPQPQAGLTVQPLHLARADDRAALVAAIAAVAPIDRTAWRQRLGVAAPAAVDAPPLPARVKPGALPWRQTNTALAVTAAAAVLWLLGRLVGARIDGLAFGPVLGRWSLQLSIAMALVLMVASGPGQQLFALAGEQLRSGLARLVAWVGMPRDTWSERNSMLSAAGLFAFMLFLAGRTFIRLGVPPAAVQLTVAVFAAAAGILMVAVLGPALLTLGGWAAIVLPLALFAAVFLSGSVSLPFLRLHDRLDEEHLSWPGAVMRALRRTLDFTSPTSAGEFWGFFAFCAIAWAVTRLLARPWDVAVALLLAMPLLALSVRTWRTLDRWGKASLAVAVVLAVLEAADR